MIRQGQAILAAHPRAEMPGFRPCAADRGRLDVLRERQEAEETAWRALCEGRDHAIPEDVKAMAVVTLAHRLGLDPKAKYAGVRKEEIVREILDRVPVGV